MTEDHQQAISPLRRRMIDDMTIRGFTAHTQRGYLGAVRDLAAYLGCSPDQGDAEALRRYQLHMRSAGASASSMNSAVSGLRFFFGVTLGRTDAAVGMTGVREPLKLPVLLSPEEVAHLLDAAPRLKYKAALSVAYGAGLRASEVISLKVTDIPRVKPEGRLAPAWSSGWNKARDTRTAMPCCRRPCSTRCAPGGGSGASRV